MLRFFHHVNHGLTKQVVKIAGDVHLSSKLVVLQVEFHDTGRGVRVPSMTDYFGFTMAAMNETGSVFASPRKGEKSPSTILYRPFSSWASNSEVVFIHIDFRAAHMLL